MTKLILTAAVLGAAAGVAVADRPAVAGRVVTPPEHRAAPVRAAVPPRAVAPAPGACNEMQPGRFTPVEVKCVIRRVFPTHLENEAIIVARCESRLDPLAFNHSSGASGVFQFLYSTWRGSWNPYRNRSRFNTVTNVKAAKVLYHWRDSNGAMYGWTPWSCSPY